jgi:Xaa-Pro aminopeptidase
MIVSVDVPCFLNPWGGFRIENGYRVTKDGAVPLLDSVQRGLIVMDYRNPIYCFNDNEQR